MSITIGSFGHRAGWTAVCVLELGGQHVLVDEHARHPDDPDTRGVVVRAYREREQALADGAARVLALGGQLGAEPGQLAGAPVFGRARGQLSAAPRNGAWLELEGRDCQRVESERAQAMFCAELERYLHVLVGAQVR